MGMDGTHGFSSIPTSADHNLLVSRALNQAANSLYTVLNGLRKWPLCHPNDEQETILYRRGLMGTGKEYDSLSLEL
jgi:hypothetical protein